MRQPGRCRSAFLDQVATSRLACPGAGRPRRLANGRAASPGMVRAARTRVRTRRPEARRPSRWRGPAGVDRRTGRSRAVRRCSDLESRCGTRHGPSCRRGCAMEPDSVRASETRGPRSCRASCRCCRWPPPPRSPARATPVASRARPPVTEPREEPGRCGLQPGVPGCPPIRAPERCLRRHRVHRDLAHRVLRQFAHGQAAAPVVDVVQVAIVRGHDRHDRAQVRWSKRRDLDGGEAAVGDAPHADGARAPRLGGQPLDGVVSIAGLVRGVLVQRGPCGRARAAHVHSAEHVAPRREPGLACNVRRAPPVVLAIRDHLEDGRESLARPVGMGDRSPEIG